MGKRWVAGLGVSVGIFVALSVAYAQFAVPTSDRVISGILTLPDKSLAQFQVREGSMLIVRDDEQGFWYGLVPHIENAKVVRFNGYKLISNPEASPTVQGTFRRLEVAIREQKALPPEAPPLAIKVLAFETAYFPTIPAMKDPSKLDPQSLQELYGASGNGFCSVTCGSTTVTSTSVRMRCGVCEGAR